ncbi:SurA N-terminal domain-containing protein [Haloechinothrix halophila]|uniref:SurA N-terminal domain-containing protein n=1 Tax=Haloechinothrix halophila TaxID=1069073 RepID=UPI00041BD410
MMDLIRRFALLVTAATTAIVLAGCSGEPTKANAAAIIGDDRISLDSVQDEVQWLLDNVPDMQQLQEQDKVSLLSRHIVQTRVRHELIGAAAQQEGLSADAGEVDELLQQVGGAEQAPSQFGVRSSRVREFASDYVLLQQLAERNLDRISVEFVGAYISGESPEQTAKEKALDLGREIAADPDQAKELAQESGTEVIDQSVTLRELASGQQTALLAASPLFSADEGTVVVTQPSPQQGSLWLVALVEDRLVGASSGGESGQPVPPQLLAQIGIQQLAPFAAEQGVEISPRFGVWDQATVAIAENEDAVASYLLPTTASSEQ